MKSKRLLLELVEYLDLFESLVPDAEQMGMRSFLTFVESMLPIHKDTSDPRADAAPADVGIARHLSLLHRYSKAYIKKALAESEYLQTEEEYTYLVCLLNDNGLTKSELNSRNGMEKTSGGEVMRRLKRDGLIEEFPSENDRRSIRVFITPKGKGELFKVFPKLHMAAKLLSSPLSQHQRKNLLFLLEHLTQEQSQHIGRLSELGLEGLMPTCQTEE
ncbi:MarR family winged helix-turn-helix transcriptional regulator [Porphyromonas sp. COT-290 OH860]|uniref:MarR family winged helix-turn-helix transcriptional regulator n=1 Tax=Porphyromonas sp. COT-290 OH860 TaxID=1515615 RepID=UPI0005C5E1F7|nr:winged helix DNA-binding protein [Porphyromonas sp. COT-290 OH860]